MTTLVDLDASHKSVVAVCRLCPWRRVELVAERPRLLVLAAAHAADEHPTSRAAGELNRRARRAEQTHLTAENPYGSGDLRT